MSITDKLHINVDVDTIQDIKEKCNKAELQYDVLSTYGEKYSGLEIESPEDPFVKLLIWGKGPDGLIQKMQLHTEYGGWFKPQTGKPFYKRHFWS